MLIDRSYARADLLNLTRIADNVAPANTVTFGYSPANRLTSATGPWSQLSWTYDGAGNRRQEVATSPGGYSDTYNYPASSHRLDSAGARTFTYTANGNLATDSRFGTTFSYAYNANNRLRTVRYEGNLTAAYTYNGLEQLTRRVITNSGVANGTVHTVHDRNGNIIAVSDATGATMREYIWLPDAGYAGTDLPLAVVDGANTPAPALYRVHADHLSRPIRMTDAAKAMVWEATWLPWGATYQVSGYSLTLDAPFPGQWYQFEADLHYNWHRHYDPTLGR